MYLKIALATISVSNHNALRAAWRQYGGPCSLVATFVVRQPLTASQRRRLPAALRKCVREEAV